MDGYNGFPTIDIEKMTFEELLDLQTKFGTEMEKYNSEARYGNEEVQEMEDFWSTCYKIVRKELEKRPEAFEIKEVLELSFERINKKKYTKVTVILNTNEQRTVRFVRNKTGSFDPVLQKHEIGEKMNKIIENIFLHLQLRLRIYLKG